MNIFRIFVLFSYFVATLAFAASSDLRQSIESKAHELQTISDQIQSTQRRLEETRGEKRTLDQELKKIDYAANQLGLSIRSSQITIEKLNLELEALQQEITITKVSIASKRNTVIKLMRELYEQDTKGLLLALFHHRNLAEITLKSRGIIDLNNALTIETKNLQQLNERLSEKSGATTAKKQERELTHRTLTNRKATLDEIKSDRKTLLAQTKNQERLYQQKLSGLEKQQAALSDELEAIEEELRKSFDPTLLPLKRPGVLAMPVANPRLTQHYGEVSWLYRGKPHNGTDFGIPIGTEIFAADDGMVLAVGDNGRLQYGKYALLKHTNSLVTLYAHLSNNRIVQKGDEVKRGQLLGYSGNTGYTVGRGHLHFGVYWEPSVRLEYFSNCNCGLVPIGVTINPLDYLPVL